MILAWQICELWISLFFETIAEAYGHRGQTDVAAWWNEMGAAAALSFHGVAAVRFYG